MDQEGWDILFCHLSDADLFYHSVFHAMFKKSLTNQNHEDLILYFLLKIHSLIFFSHSLILMFKSRIHFETCLFMVMSDSL